MATEAYTTPLDGLQSVQVVNLGAERRKRVERNRFPMQSTEMALILSMMALLSAKKGRRLRDDLARWTTAHPNDAAIRSAHKAAAAIWGHA